MVNGPPLAYIEILIGQSLGDGKSYLYGQIMVLFVPIEQPTERFLQTHHYRN